MAIKSNTQDHKTDYLCAFLERKDKKKRKEKKKLSRQ